MWSFCCCNHPPPPTEFKSAIAKVWKSGFPMFQPTRGARVATISAVSLTGLITVDGVRLVDGDLVLVKAQASASANGLYTASAGAWQRQALDYQGMYFHVWQGSQAGWYCGSDAGGNVGFTPIGLFNYRDLFAREILTTAAFVLPDITFTARAASTDHKPIGPVVTGADLLVDGVAAAQGPQYLFLNQNDPAENGLYVLKGPLIGSPPFHWERSDPTLANLNNLTVLVDEGATLSGTVWQFTNGPLSLKRYRKTWRTPIDFLPTYGYLKGDDYQFVSIDSIGLISPVGPITFDRDGQLPPANGNAPTSDGTARYTVRTDAGTTHQTVMLPGEFISGLNFTHYLAKTETSLLSYFRDPAKDLTTWSFVDVYQAIPVAIESFAGSHFRRFRRWRETTVITTPTGSATARREWLLDWQGSPRGQQRVEMVDWQPSGIDTTTLPGFNMREGVLDFPNYASGGQDFNLVNESAEGTHWERTFKFGRNANVYRVTQSVDISEEIFDGAVTDKWNAAMAAHNLDAQPWGYTGFNLFWSDGTLRQGGDGTNVSLKNGDFKILPLANYLLIDTYTLGAIILAKP